MTPKIQLENRRETIVNAAIGCFIDKGFHATSMRDIAQAASVSLGNLYNYFPGKESLIAEVAIREQDELAPLLTALRDKNTAANIRVENFLRTYSALCSQREWAVLAAECLAEIARNAELAPAFEENQARTLSALEAAIEDGNAQGIFTPQVPPGIVAQLLLDAVESEAMRRVLMRRPTRSDAEPHEALNKKLVQALLGI
jgi:AcrR family transcriptional regulator